MMFSKTIISKYKKPFIGFFFYSIYKKVNPMKKVLEIVNNPINLLGIGGVFFVIAFINSLMNDASSMTDLDWWGKGATIGFCIVLTALLVRFGVLPLFQWFTSLVK